MTVKFGAQEVSLWGGCQFRGIDVLVVDEPEHSTFRYLSVTTEWRGDTVVNTKVRTRDHILIANWPGEAVSPLDAMRRLGFEDVA